VVIEGRMKEVIVDEYCIMCSKRPELFHDGEVESIGQSI
jgi:hypothetical protein